MKTHTARIRGVKIHPPNFGGEYSKITCFIVFLAFIPETRKGAIFTPQIGGVWVFGERQRKKRREGKKERRKEINPKTNKETERNKKIGKHGNNNRQ